MYSFLNVLCGYWRLEAITPQEDLEKHCLLQFLTANFEPIFCFVSALNCV